MPKIDILVITFDRPKYAQLALERLLSTCTPNMDVWLWHNGQAAETLAVAQSFSRHPRVARFHHSIENQRLREPTNWLWRNSAADYLSKVDDDCLVEPGWADKLVDAHEQNAQFGVIGSWRFYEEDFRPELAYQKIERYDGVSVMRNLWVQGSGYLMKRRCVEAQGLLRSRESFTNYCIRLAQRGFVNGWLFPFIHEEHMDDPRSELSGLHTDADLQRRLPLSAANLGITTVADWEEQMRRSARRLQEASLDPSDYVGVRARLRRWALNRMPSALLRRIP